MPEIAIQTAGGTTRALSRSPAQQVTIGRSRESDIFLPDQWLSRNHAAIELRPEGYFVNDLKSKNGTLLNGEPLQDWRRLRPGDIITLGEHTLTFSPDAVGGRGGARARGNPGLLGPRAQRHLHAAGHRPRRPRSARTASSPS